MGFVTAPCRFMYTLPQCMQADGRVSGESLTCGSVNLTLGIGRASWSEFGCPFTRLYQDSLPLSFPPPMGRLHFATPLERYAQACYPRPREEPAPRPGNPTLKRGKAPGIRRGVPCGRPVAVKTRLSDPAPSPCPPLPRGATLVPRNPAPALQIRAGSPAPPAMNTTECRRNEQTSPSREACPRGSMP